MEDVYDLVDDLLSYATYDRKLSEHTVSYIGRFLDFLFDEIQSKQGIPNLTVQDIEGFNRNDWLGYLRCVEKNRKFGGASCNLFRYSLRFFLGYLRKRGFDVVDPNLIQNYKVRQSPFIVPSEEYVSKVLDAISNPRDRAIFMFVICHAARVEEIISLKMSDFDGEFVKIGDQSVELENEVLDALESYRFVRRKSGEDALFVSRNGGSLHRRSVQNLFVKYAKVVGLEVAPILAFRRFSILRYWKRCRSTNKTMVFARMKRDVGIRRILDVYGEYAESVIGKG